MAEDSVWKGLVIGWGIEPIPRILARSMCCRICGCRSGLYTMERTLPDTPGAKAYSRMVERIRLDSWCKVHLKWYLQEEGKEV